MQSTDHSTHNPCETPRDCSRPHTQSTLSQSVSLTEDLSPHLPDLRPYVRFMRRRIVLPPRLPQTWSIRICPPRRRCSCWASSCRARSRSPPRRRAALGSHPLLEFELLLRQSRCFCLPARLCSLPRFLPHQPRRFARHSFSFLAYHLPLLVLSCPPLPASAAASSSSSSCSSLAPLTHTTACIARQDGLLS